MKNMQECKISDQPLNRQNPLNRQYLLNKIYPCHCTGWLNTLCHTSNQHFFEQKMWETAVRKQESDFLGGKQVSGNRCLDMIPGNRCRETGVLIPFGIRCQETGVLFPFGNRCQETRVSIPFGNRCRETGVLIPCGNRCLDSIVTEH